jgi:hypothetical protein
MDAFSLAKLTLTPDTPGSLDSPFSTLAAQEAQVMPVMGRITLLAVLVSLAIYR